MDVTQQIVELDAWHRRVMDETAERFDNIRISRDGMSREAWNAARKAHGAARDAAERANQDEYRRRRAAILGKTWEEETEEIERVLRGE